MIGSIVIAFVSGILLMTFVSTFLFRELNRIHRRELNQIGLDMAKAQNNFRDMARDYGRAFDPGERMGGSMGVNIGAGPFAHIDPNTVEFEGVRPIDEQKVYIKNETESVDDFGKVRHIEFAVEPLTERNEYD